MPKPKNPPVPAPQVGDKTRPADPRPEPGPVAASPAVPGEPPVETPPAADPPAAEKKPEIKPQPPVEDKPADPVIDNPEPNENDCEFVLRIFGVPPSKYVTDGALDREALQLDLDARRHLFANRVLHRRSGA